MEQRSQRLKHNQLLLGRVLTRVQSLFLKAAVEHETPSPEGGSAIADRIVLNSH